MEVLRACLDSAGRAVYPTNAAIAFRAEIRNPRSWTDWIAPYQFVVLTVSEISGVKVFPPGMWGGRRRKRAFRQALHQGCGGEQQAYHSRAAMGSLRRNGAENAAFGDRRQHTSHRSHKRHRKCGRGRSARLSRILVPHGKRPAEMPATRSSLAMILGCLVGFSLQAPVQAELSFDTRNYEFRFKQELGKSVRRRSIRSQRGSARSSRETHEEDQGLEGSAARLRRAEALLRTGSKLQRRAIGMASRSANTRQSKGSPER